MKRLFPIAIISALISGCSTLSSVTSLWSDEDESTQMQYVEKIPEVHVVNVDSRSEPVEMEQGTGLDQHYRSNMAGGTSGQPQYANGQGVYNGRMLTKHVGDYAQNMMQNLMSNMEYVTDKTPIGVTHFALVDSDLQQTNLLGYQLAESFMHELHKFRIPVIDYKATEYIRVTESGDFFLSRDFLELKNKAPVDYILTGTMTKHQGGYLVNARIIGLQSKAIVASAQALVPFYVVDALLPSEQGMMDGVKISKG